MIATCKYDYLRGPCSCEVVESKSRSARRKLPNRRHALCILRQPEEDAARNRGGNVEGHAQAAVLSGAAHGPLHEWQHGRDGPHQQRHALDEASGGQKHEAREAVRLLDVQLQTTHALL